MVVITEKDKKKSRQEYRGSWYCEKFWLKINGVDYLFKGNDDSTFFGPSKRTDLGEMFYSVLSQKINFDCVKTKFAKYTTRNSSNNGVLVKTFLTKPNMYSVNYFELAQFYETIFGEIKEILCVQNCLKIFEFYANKHNLKYNFNKIKTELYCRTVLDFFLAQTDRHTQNIEFLIDGDTISLAPSFDNGRCLSFGNSAFENKEIIKQIKNNNYQGEHFKKLYFKQEKPIDRNVYYTTKSIEREFFKTMVKVCEEEPEVKSFLKNLLKIDVEKEIKMLGVDCEEKVEKDMILSSVLMFNDKRNAFLTFLQRRQNMDFLREKPKELEKN